ncbi:DPP IV N-terminal domain-containing protein [Candidatus Poribacteria bacterium]|nr:DPP IV N-terminal domain-containing protein [Candidatus Poribacteria bacterium]
MKGSQGTLEDYQRAEQFLEPNVNHLVRNEQVTPNWINESNRFSYKRQLPDGKQFLLVDASQNTREPAFDHERLATALSQATGVECTAVDLPFERFEFVEDGQAIHFVVGDARYDCNLTNYECCQIGQVESPSRELERTSPDGKWVAFLQDHNLFVRSVESGEVIELSDDGVGKYDYTASLPSPPTMVDAGTQHVQMPVAAFWSPDSKRIVSYRLDQRSARTFTVVQSSPPNQLRPIAYTYAYALPGEIGLTKAEPVIFDVENRTSIPVQTEPLNLLYYGGPTFTWFADSQRFYYRYVERGGRVAQLREVDANSGKVRVLVEERGDLYINTWNLISRFLDEGAEIIASSERDGWNHLYFHDGKAGQMKHQITKGEWVVRDIVHVDENARQIYFNASGKEKGRDPYLRHLYRINTDGTDLQLLTPEDAEHTIHMSPTGEYFVDTYSRPDLAPVSVLRRSADGEVVMELERADIERLLATGWQYPEAFKAKARDGKTDIYGIIWRPSNLDPSRKYPVVEEIYTGPHGFFVPKTFQAYLRMSQAIAELGFITVQIDGLGTNKRSKAFNDFSCQNLGDGGIPDHIAALRQLADEYPYIDLDRVGIWGGSAGGYDSTHALLTNPEFYKVAVSTSGNHDHRLDKASWVETWMGFPLGEHYVEQSNVTLAHKLKGKLLLAHGELDDNVHLSSTLQLVDALIKANKDFDLLIMPGRFHGLGGPYFTRKRWDYFVKHLLGIDPPDGYQIGNEASD